MPMDADYALLKKWSNWFDRKNGSGYGPANILQRRTMNTAIVTVSTLQNIPFTELSSSLYFFCSDIDSKEFSRLYESQVELAGANPDKFIKGLHSFFNSMAKRIKNASEYALFFDFLMAASRLLFTAKEEKQSNINIRHCGITMLHLKENIPLVVILNESVDVGRITVTLVFNSHAREADELFHPCGKSNVVLPHGSLLSAGIPLSGGCLCRF